MKSYSWDIYCLVDKDVELISSSKILGGTKVDVIYKVRSVVNEAVSALLIPLVTCPYIEHVVG
jgi:hypothetical protein